MMKHTLTLLTALLLPSVGAAEDLTVAANGKSPYVIAYSDAETVDQMRATQAAFALQLYLREATGVTLPVMAEYKAVLGESDGECMDCGQKTAPNGLCGGAVEYRDRPRNSILDEKSACRLEGREPFC